jgi:hypothetical protein
MTSAASLGAHANVRSSYPAACKALFVAITVASGNGNPYQKIDQHNAITVLNDCLGFVDDALIV